MRETLLLFIVLTEYCSSSCLFCPVLSSLRTNDHRNNPVMDNNTRRFLFVTYRRVPYTARASTNGSRRHIVALIVARLGQ